MTNGRTNLHMTKRLLSLLLCVVLLVSVLPMLNTPVHAATTSQNNIVARADYLYGITWKCQKTVYGWRKNYVFNAGSTYRIPYGQPVSSGYYIGFGVSVDTFVSATKNESSVFYTSRSSYGSTNSVYYAMDCSAFVSWCWGISRKTTASIPQVSSNLGKATSSNISKLQLGDALNSSSVGHVVLVTGLTYSGSSITQIEITEQTPPQLKRSYYTPSSLASKYGSSYTIQRYSGSVPAAPGGSSSSSGSSSGSAVTTQYFPACASSYTSIVDALNSIGVDSSKENRILIATVNGILNYTGTEDQNIALLDLLKAGKLLNPNYKDVAYYPATSAGSTLIEALEAIGVDSSKDYRAKIAAANNISNYTGTYDQNITMLELLRAGKLINPEGSSSSSSGSSGSSDTTQNGYTRGYAGGMAGDGKIYAHGLDVSAWQEEDLDFNMIKNAGYSYVILRAGTGKGKDSCFETYYTNAKKAGLNVGAYYYSYATTVAGAQTDASNMLTWIKGKTFEYPIYFDYEDASQDSLSSTTSKNICLTFCDAMANAGYLTGIYTGYSRSTNLPMSEICAKYEAWIAHYRDYTYETLSPTYSGKFGMYQYTDRNYIGSEGPFDGNVSFKDYPAIVKKYGFNGYAATVSVDYLSMCTAYETHCKVITLKSTPLNSLPCSATSSYGSVTLLTEEAGKTYIAKKLYSNTSGNFWYQITLETGETAYLYNYHCEYVEPVDTDIVLVGGVAPGRLEPGQDFEISGTVSTLCHKLDGVQVVVTNAQGNTVLSVPVETVDNMCDLADVKLNFASLPLGDYQYKVLANYSGKYAISDSESETYNAQVALMDTAFTVGGEISEPDPENPPVTIRDPYLDECTFYPSHCLVFTTQVAPLNMLPCNVDSNGAQTLLTADSGNSYTATAVVKNTEGTYWYQLLLDTGETAYLSGDYARFADSFDTDLVLSVTEVLEDLYVGQNYTVYGCVESMLNDLEEVRVLICSMDETELFSTTVVASDNVCDLTGLALNFGSLTAGDYLYKIEADYSGYFAANATECGRYTARTVLMKMVFTVTDCEHDYAVHVIQQGSCTVNGILENICTICGDTNTQVMEATGHSYTLSIQSPTCVSAGMKTYLCSGCANKIEEPISATGHSYAGGQCVTCGAADPNHNPSVTVPKLTLKSPTLEFKDMITVNALYTAENIQDVVEMGMITYSTQVSTWSVETAEYVIPGATYMEGTGQYVSSSQGIHAKYLGDKVYLAIYAKLTDGTYTYSKLASYSPVQYATNQLNKSTDVKLRKLVAAMLNYGAEAQLYFGHNVQSLANSTLTIDQKALPDSYRADMIATVAAASAEKQGVFANNQGFASRKPAISFEGAFCINYFFTPKYVPDSGITLYYWNAEDYNAATVLTAANATGKFKLEGSGTGEYRGDITGISAKALSEAVYVACAYKSGGAVWTSGVLGYSIGAYCSGQASKANAISDLAMATAVYGYHAKQYFS